MPGSDYSRVSVADIIFAVITVLFVAKTLFIAANTIGVRRFLCQRQSSEEVSSEGPAIYILVPMLREQARFGPCFQQFVHWLEYSKRYRLCFVTTERESTEFPIDGDQKTTPQLVREALSSSPTLEDRLFHYHYPRSNRTIAEQLHFGVNCIYDDETFKVEQDFILLYTADSEPSAHSARYFLHAAEQKVPVAQQSALFFRNIDYLVEAGRFGCAADAVFQSRWTLQEEMPRFIRSALTFRERLALPILGTSLLAHCVSHGLLIRGGVLQSVGGMPVPKIGLEDSALGFALRARAIPIVACPILESADAAAEFRTLARQKAQWFLGPFGAPEYAKLAITAGVDAWRVRRLLAESLMSAVKWLTGGLAVVGYVGLGIACGYGSLATGVYVLYCAIPVSVLLTVREAEVLRASICRRPFRWLVVFVIYPLTYVWNSVFAALGLYRWVKMVVLGQVFHQSKTAFIK